MELFRNKLSPFLLPSTHFKPIVVNSIYHNLQSLATIFMENQYCCTSAMFLFSFFYFLQVFKAAIIFPSGVKQALNWTRSSSKISPRASNSFLFKAAKMNEIASSSNFFKASFSARPPQRDAANPLSSCKLWIHFLPCTVSLLLPTLHSC